MVPIMTLTVQVMVSKAANMLFKCLPGRNGVMIWTPCRREWPAFSLCRGRCQLLRAGAVVSGR